MESLNALLQGMGLMHLGAGQAIMLLVSLLLLWLAIAKKFEPLLLLPIGFGGLLSNIPEAGMALTALESLLAHHDAGQLAVIAAKLNCAPDVHAIKEALSASNSLRTATTRRRLSHCRRRKPRSRWKKQRSLPPPVSTPWKWKAKPLW